MLVFHASFCKILKIPLFNLSFLCANLGFRKKVMGTSKREGRCSKKSAAGKYVSFAYKVSSVWFIGPSSL